MKRARMEAEARRADRKLAARLRKIKKKQEKAAKAADNVIVSPSRALVTTWLFSHRTRTLRVQRKAELQRRMAKAEEHAYRQAASRARKAAARQAQREAAERAALERKRQQAAKREREVQRRKAAWEAALDHRTQEQRRRVLAQVREPPSPKPRARRLTCLQPTLCTHPGCGTSARPHREARASRGVRAASVQLGRQWEWRRSTTRSRSQSQSRSWSWSWPAQSQ